MINDQNLDDSRGGYSISQRGVANPKEEPNFPESCMKMKKIGSGIFYYVDPPLDS